MTNTHGHHWLQLILGSLELGNKILAPGDGVSMNGSVPEIKAMEFSEFLLFSL